MNHDHEAAQRKRRKIPCPYGRMRTVKGRSRLKSKFQARLRKCVIVPMGGPTMMSARFYLFGPHANGIAPEYESAWQAWFSQRFPADGASQGA